VCGVVESNVEKISRMLEHIRELEVKIEGRNG
jgi:hypothetical protein